MDRCILKSSGIIIVLLALPAFAVEVQRIGWQDLLPQTALIVEDPFADLTAKQLRQLSSYARVSRMLVETPAKVTDGMRAEAKAAEAALREQEVDIEGLLARRKEFKNLRTRRTNATVESLDGVHVSIPGYALPLEMDGQLVTEFLLVPWVGACIHTPPPPPNQIVHVKLNAGIEVDNRYRPVWVTGKMTVGAAQKELYFVDGSAPIDFGYSIAGANVEYYEGNQ